LPWLKLFEKRPRGRQGRAESGRNAKILTSKMTAWLLICSNAADSSGYEVIPAINLSTRWKWRRFAAAAITLDLLMKPTSGWRSAAIEA